MLPDRPITSRLDHPPLIVPGIQHRELFSRCFRFYFFLLFLILVIATGFLCFFNIILSSLGTVEFQQLTHFFRRQSERKPGSTTVVLFSFLLPFFSFFAIFLPSARPISGRPFRSPWCQEMISAHALLLSTACGISALAVIFVEALIHRSSALLFTSC